MYQKLIKRGSDIVVSLIAIILLLPFLALVALIVFASDGKNPLLAQKRIGKNGKEFLMYKFRSMKADAPEIPTSLLKNPDDYITPLGRILRKSSIDELPQLFNILRGDMSLVGPRPALWNEADLIKARDERGINSILPGLTGWSQVNGRARLSLERRIALDAEYAAALLKGGTTALKMDVRCVLKTFIVIFNFKDVT